MTLFSSNHDNIPNLSSNFKYSLFYIKSLYRSEEKQLRGVKMQMDAPKVEEP